MDGTQHIFKTRQDLLDWANSLEGENFPISVKWDKKRDVRTLTQNNAIYLYCQMQADALNAAGQTITYCIENDKLQLEQEWTKDSFKKSIWNPVQEQTYGHTHSSKLKTNEVSIVYESIVRALASRGLQTTDFPSRFG